MVMATVLVVDDEPDILAILRVTLEASGYAVVTAADGAEALEAVERERPDAVLLDVGMPKVDGWQVLARIKASSDEMSQVPVVMLTAWSGERDRIRGGIEGAVHYLGKPFDPGEVVDVLAGVLAADAPPEPEQRRRVRVESMERLAHIEGGPGSVVPIGPRVHLTRLDRADREPPPRGLTRATLPGFLASLPPVQREVATRVAEGIAPAAVARELGVSRSNVYAVLRRAARRADLPDGRALIRLLRSSAKERTR